jgi:hypothetical protein
MTIGHNLNSTFKSVHTHVEVDYNTPTIALRVIRGGKTCIWWRGGGGHNSATLILGDINRGVSDGIIKHGYRSCTTHTIE